MAAPVLILVKHAMPEIVPVAPSREWRLSEAGRRGSLALADALAPWSPAIVIGSREPKALETATIAAGHLGVPWLTADGLHENDRTGLPYLDQPAYDERFAAFFAQPGERLVGNETADEAPDRFAAAAEPVLAAHTGTVAVVAQGTVISLFVTRVAGFDPFPLWKRLGLPSFVVLSRPALDVLAIVEDTTTAARGGR